MASPILAGKRTTRQDKPIAGPGPRISDRSGIGMRAWEKCTEKNGFCDSFISLLNISIKAQCFVINQFAPKFMNR